jgi:hypothetical protein
MATQKDTSFSLHSSRFLAFLHSSQSLHSRLLGNGARRFLARRRRKAKTVEARSWPLGLLVGEEGGVLGQELEQARVTVERQAAEQ